MTDQETIEAGAFFQGVDITSRPWQTFDVRRGRLIAAFFQSAPGAAPMRDNIIDDPVWRAWTLAVLQTPGMVPWLGRWVSQVSPTLVFTYMVATRDGRLGEMLPGTLNVAGSAWKLIEIHQELLANEDPDRTGLYELVSLYAGPQTFTVITANGGRAVVGGSGAAAIAAALGPPAPGPTTTNAPPPAAPPSTAAAPASVIPAAVPLPAAVRSSNLQLAAAGLAVLILLAVLEVQQ